MRIPGASRYRARVPSGLPGPGGIIGGSLAAQHPGCRRQGLIQEGFSALLMTDQLPGGVGKPAMAVATGYLRSTRKPLYRVSMLAVRLTTMVLPSLASVTLGFRASMGKRTVAG